MLDRRGAGEVERKRRLTHRGAGGDDDHLTGVQTVGELVETREPGRDAGHLTVSTARGLDLLDRRVDGDRQRNVVLGGVIAGDVVDLGLRVVHQVERITLPLVPHLHDAGARIHQPAEEGALGDDRGVVARVRRRRHDRGERVQVVGAAGPLQLAGLDELVGDGDHIGGLTVRVEAEDGLEDQLMLGHVEVGAAECLDDVGDGILRQQHAPQGALLGEEVVRGRALVLAGSTKSVG